VLGVRIRIGSDPHHFADQDQDRHAGHVDPKPQFQAHVFFNFSRKFQYDGQNTYNHDNFLLMRKENHKLALLWIKIKIFSLFCIMFKTWVRIRMWVGIVLMPIQSRIRIWININMQIQIRTVLSEQIFLIPECYIFHLGPPLRTTGTKPPTKDASSPPERSFSSRQREHF
jgi:hypothetical protein